MQGIEFEEDKNFSGIKSKAIEPTVARQGFIMKLMVRIGFADNATANLVLLSFAALLFGTAIFLYAEILVEPEKDWSLDARAILEAHEYKR
ncbi:MAG: hypothetical protein COV32_02730 [Candidatus Yonathbacteria bacterium CG10_big_fil_rev_8_21_14_0_10_43_136]|uniref:Uncharacterized protein n=2 Tax=Parcubacteria group TaxID=1794811 RepID=A0A2M7Q515_9BACT|nr:MAG: hypothetical protein AUK15_01935 [Candidatus Nomurabacteria bacterium CG2_30_43_9]PIQ36136.1 MAG: hypothetical protein COW60_00265 [Candidatus Yonathbacteria bacterium CG17_big_fil_post_rev_8_21_14_2_50_43_9]PIR40550.1 MAG: hypothetical protein COV32_02730 [Candidatus Yonathbacteria bacterium CG10_big_fil_rev_8_21_14_0_10_43_136]PIX57009.1 MAG: hypothetical protein COZ48_03035 [Candidatus Yonathbacteria bacterium CG_4_10_14_3_um_filter_43_12]PIY58160.1 MAG: hypothetical protein COY98_03